jgi:glutathione S-transferase
MKSPDDQESAVLPVLYGARYSVYTRICLSAFEMKDVPFHFAPLDVFAADGHAEARRAGHPFGKIPVLHHGSLTIYETLAITRYIDDRFDGPPLQPDDAAGRARMNQFISLVDTQVYPVLVWGLHVPKSEGRKPKPGTLGKGRAVLAALETLAGPEWLCGARPTLADAYLAACMDYIIDSAAGNDMAGNAPRLMAWWQRAQALKPKD